MPVYNQIEELPKVLRELHANPLRCSTLLLVNNGSSDGSEELVRNSGFEYIDLEKNKGVGFSCMAALDWALQRDYSFFGMMASNGKMLPSEMGRILDPLENGDADYVTGSRFIAGGGSPNLPAFRRSSIPMVNVFVKLLTGKTLTDATCGYRAFDISIIKRATFDWHHTWLNTYGLEYYIYGQVLMEPSVRWIEVPITMRYPDKGRRYTKIKPFVGWYQMLKPFVVAKFDRKGFETLPSTKR